MKGIDGIAKENHIFDYESFWRCLPEKAIARSFQ